MKRILFSFLLITVLQGLTKAQCPGNCTLYTISNITYSPVANAGTTLSLADDQVSAAIPIGFTFTFMCNAYTQLYIVSNGFISFNPAVGTGCCSGQLCPTAGGNPNNYVALFWNDLYPPGAGTIKYQTIGTAPNRIFVVTYSLIPFCCGAGPPNVSGQIKLFETSNNIEVHNIAVGNQGSNQTQGIMDQTGAAGYAVAGRNAAAWTATTDAYRFTPSAAQPSCTGAPVPGTAAASPTTGCGTLTVNLSLSGTSGTCGATYQWQVAPAPGGPYTNIAGATSVTAVTTATVTSYYRCVLACAGQTAASTNVQVLIPTCTGAPGAGSAVATPTTGCGTVTTNLSLTGTTGTCGATYQWQSAAAPGGPYTNIAGATSMTAVTTATATRYFRCLLSCAGQTSTCSIVQVSVTAPPCPVGTGVWYINSNVGQPWGTNTNWTSLNTVFSNTWTQDYFETVNLASAFNQTTCLVFLEGGDNNALAMNTFMTNNITTIQNWVSNGGHLYINAAPNQGGNMNWGFGGLTLTYPPNLSTTGNASIPGHPIFSGPYAPCTTSYTGNYWSHATVSGGGISQIMLGQFGNTMGEFNYGAGRVMAGGMTTPNWHSPSPDAQNFLSNTLNYMYGCTVIPLPVELTEFRLNYNGDVSELTWTTASEKNTDYYLIEKSSDGKTYSFFDKVIAAGNSEEPKNYNVTDPHPNKTGITYYRLKQFDKHSNDPAFSQIKVLSLYGDKTKMRVQPNPASTNLGIVLPSNFISDFNIQVFDRSGAKVMSTQGTYNSKEPLNLNIENLQSGFYIIHIFDNAGNSSKTTFIKN